MNSYFLNHFGKDGTKPCFKGKNACMAQDLLPVYSVF